ncbi:phosphonate transport system permease protein [Pseudomonas psychrotolerans]|uniref:Phosphonate transport system permease protein n=1 Tax=Pseudomonas oryzihabitans TaxID=47885 RepID=A0AAJ2BND1_9PSED|nr:phosphonate transport system permease protein [Pseudomonas psychrotolerans]
MLNPPQRDPAARPRLLLTLLALLLAWPTLHLAEFDLLGLFSGDNARTMGLFLAGFWPPAHDADFLAVLGRATLETLAIATLGMALAALIALPAALLATRALSISALPRAGRPGRLPRLLRGLIRGVLIVLRSVPEIVWALLFVRAVGLGPTAGVLAIAITYGGMLGKVYAEIFESVDPRPARALLLQGAGRLQAFVYGVLPNAASEMISYSVYRWECAIRASVVMGFVGAGGLGQQVDLSLRMFAGGEVASLLLTFLLLVLLADVLSRLLRQVERGRSRGRGALTLVALIAALVASASYLGTAFGELLSARALGQMGSFLADFLRPDFSLGQLTAVARGAVETLAMSALGTLLAGLLGLSLALPAAGRLGLAALALARLLLNALRAVPELVWAALMVLAAGLGPNAGTLALALHTAGVLGRLFAEALENTPKAPAEAIRLAGAGPLTAFLYGTLPAVWPQLLAYLLYRWENNIRMASILGFVGAGGLGQQLYFSLSLFQQAQAATVILGMLVLVLGVDGLSNWARQRWVVR